MDETLASDSSSLTPTGTETALAVTSPAPDSPASPSGAPAFIREHPKSPAQQALERAQAKLAKSSPPLQAAADGEASTDSPTLEQAAAGDSTPGEEKTATDDETGTSTPPAVSTPSAPQHWDANLKDAFEAIPTDAGKAAMLDVYKSVQGRFTEGMQAIKQREQQLDSLVQLQTSFETNPKAVIQQIAEAAGLPVWFEPPAPAGEIPDFQDPKDLAKWAKEQALAELQAHTKSEIEQFRLAQQKERAAAEFKSELEAAAGKYPDFVANQTGILQVLNDWPQLPVERAYQLATFPAIAKRAAEGEAALKELKELKAQLKASKANTMRPVVGQVGEAKTNGEAHMSPAERAFVRAQRRLAAQAAS